MEGALVEVVKVILNQYGALGFFVCLSFYLLYVVFKDRKKPANGNGVYMTYVRKTEFDDHVRKTGDHLGVIEGRMADAYKEFQSFRIEVAKELVTKEDLEESERRIKDHISLVSRRR